MCSKLSIAVLLLLFLVAGNFSCHLRSKSVLETQPAPPPATVVKVDLPAQSGFVNDFAGVFKDDEKARLETLLDKLMSSGKINFAVVTVETTSGQPIFDYSLALARDWNIDPLGSGGILLMLAIKDRNWRIQVSTSLEKELPDEVCKELGDQSQELYKQGRYAEGIEKYVRAIISRLEQTRNFRMA